MSSEHKLTDIKLDFLPFDIINSLKSNSSANVNSKETVLPKDTKLFSKALTANEKTSKLTSFVDLSAVRGEEIKKLNPLMEKFSVKSLIPDELYVRKNELVRHLEYDDHELATVEEADNELIIFPTEFPQSRDQVKYLRKTLEKLLDANDQADVVLDNFCMATVDDVDVMIDLIGRLDGIYKTILHELARQIMTSCEPRGLVVIELRNKYMDLVSRVPQELLKLKTNVKDQVVKDKKLTFQIEEFQEAITYLTEQLKEVKIRDIKVTENAESIHKELEAALQDSARSKELLNEYHVLYDLQRQRLDRHMSVINNEKEEWSSLAFALSLKISEESLLNTTRRLRLVTKKLIQLSKHFAIYISDCDTVLTSKIQDLSGKCLRQIMKIHTETSKTMNNFHDLFHFLKSEFEAFTRHGVVDIKAILDMVVNHLSSLRGFLAEDALKKIITDISLLNINNYKTINELINVQLDEWADNFDKIRHRKALVSISETVSAPVMPEFTDVFQIIRKWTRDFSGRIALISNFEPFFNDLKFHILMVEEKIAVFKLKEEFDNESDGVGFIFSMINDLYLEMFKNPDLIAVQKNEDFTEFNQFLNMIQKSLVAFSNTIDTFDSRLMENINVQQTRITDWIIDALFLFSNMKNTENIEMKFKTFSESFGTIVQENNAIFQYLIEWTEIFSMGADEETKKIEMAEYTEENSAWTSVAEMLIKDIGDKIEQELMTRRRQSEKLFEKMSLENIDEIINDIVDKNTDKGMYLAIDSVKNLQSEIVDTLTRISTANGNRESLSNKLEQQQINIRDFEDKIASLTAEYRELVKTD